MHWFHNGRKLRGFRILGAMALAALGIAFTVAPVHARETGNTCQDLRFPVSVAGLPHTMAGT